MTIKPTLVLPSLNAQVAHSSTSHSLSSESVINTTATTNDPPISRRPPLSLAALASPIPPSSLLAAAPSGPPPDLPNSLYPTTLSSFDPDAEDGGKLTDPRKIILDIQTAMNGPPALTPPIAPDSDFPSGSRSRSTSRSTIPLSDSHAFSSNLSTRPSNLNLPHLPQRNNLDPLPLSLPPDPFSALAHDPLHQSEFAEPEFDLEPSDIKILNSLGEGAGGEVKRVLHEPSGLYMAKKSIPTSPNPSVHRQILRELAFNREVADGKSPWIVKYYGAFLEENDTQIAILMEYCEGGSLESIQKRIKSRQGRIGEKVLGKVAHSVLEGLAYLHTRKIIHRDIKPSNIVVTRSGQIKLCDLGVSGELIGSLAGTFMGTSAYMAPERIRGEKYSITSDVWSLGLTLLELALNRFPLSNVNQDGSTTTLHPFELLQTVVTFEMPRMDEEESIGVKWTKGLQNFLSHCLDKNPNNRPGPKALLDQHSWVLKTKSWSPDLAKWLSDVWGWQMAS